MGSGAFQCHGHFLTGTPKDHVSKRICPRLTILYYMNKAQSRASYMFMCRFLLSRKDKPKGWGFSCSGRTLTNFVSNLAILFQHLKKMLPLIKDINP